MPSYLFHCPTCNKDTTITKKMSDYTPNEPCPECSTIMQRKVEDMVCGMSIDRTNGFYRKVN